MSSQAIAMAVGPLDELRTRLTLEGNFPEKAKASKVAAEEVAEAITEVEKAAKALEKEAKKLDDAMDEQASSLVGGASGFKRYADTALQAGIRTSPVLMNIAGAGVKAATAVGANLATAAQTFASALFSPAGLIAALVIVGTTLAAITLSAGFAFGAITGGLSAILSMAPLLASTFTSVVGPALALPFIKASAEMDRYHRQFTAIFGGKEQGDQATQWMQQYGLTSPLSQPSIAQLMRVIGQGGKDVNRFMPVAETLSLAGREDPDTNARDIASIFMRLIGGQIADAFGPEGLGRFGINREMLGSAGAKFDKSGSFIGNTDDALAVLEKLTQTHPVLKDLRALMETSTDTRLSNAWDAVQLSIQKTGAVLTEKILPIIEQASEWLRNLTQNGAIENIAQKFADMVGGPNGIKGMIAYALAFIENVPRLFDAAVQLAKAVGDTLLQVVLAIGLAVKNLIPIIGPAIGDAIIAGAATGKSALSNLPGLASGVLDFATEGNFSGDVKRYLALMDRPGNTGSGVLPPGVATPPVDEVANEHLAGIERNTRELVDAQRIILGGGSLGAGGVTAADVFGRKRGGGGRGGGFGDRIADAIYETIGEVLDGERRAMGM
jgi:hypothetical protein